MSAQSAESSRLNSGQILRFYVPLALSWLFMATESPIATSIIGRRPNPEVNAAAFFLMIGIAYFLESPIIDLLSTSTTLAKSHSDHAVLRRFVYWLLAVVTVGHILIALTPLYDIVMTKLIEARPDVAKAAHPGLVVLIPWSAFIGWRRYLQGILIRFDRTRFVGLGTAIRVSSVALIGGILYLTTSLSGLLISSIALICSVAAEATFVHVVTHRVIREKLRPQEGEEATLTMGRLLKFHLPLTATTMVIMASNPLIGGFMSRAPQAVLSQAAWQFSTSLVWLHRTVTFALPEVVITLQKDKETSRILKRFCLQVGFAMSGSLLVFSLIGIDKLYFANVLGAPENTQPLAHTAYLLSVLLPLIGAAQSYVRGMLTAYHLTVARFVAVGVGSLFLLIGLGGGIAFQLSGVAMGAIASTLGLSAELAALVYMWMRHSPMNGRPDPEPQILSEAVPDAVAQL